jgi:hypothetical protein
MAVSADQIALSYLGFQSLTAMAKHFCDRFDLGCRITVMKLHANWMKFLFAIDTRPFGLEVIYESFAFVIAFSLPL